ncbi:GNAT family N-acetyltransferase [Desulfosporosinus sp. OT]|uniref:GNAT family N-acetyltransferase n=1 Tax=Desulfosporosinus sp. OT TaxID=913865 RepID=UPI000223A157|nr:GNAT family N-acetyltransferase [Desulfosporosinus sp. OT]EGW39299.1 hypothetical protein DOT_2761 [Desulfosporosinus sp. OT]
MIIRKIEKSDYTPIISVVDEWWGGRHMADMLPKLFFRHFKDTSFIAEVDGDLGAFLIGFISQSHSNEAYIHFIGVNPEYRTMGLGRKLYLTFFEKVVTKGCNIVQCVTSPVNTGSIGFHTRMGFNIEKGDCQINGVSVHSNYDGPGEDRVLFFRQL